MEIFELYSVEKAIFCLTKLQFIKVRCIIDINKICGLPHEKINRCLTDIFKI